MPRAKKFVCTSIFRLLITAPLLIVPSARAGSCENFDFTPAQPGQGQGFQFDIKMGSKFSVYVVVPTGIDSWRIRRYGYPSTAQDTNSFITLEIGEAVDSICGKGFFANTGSDSIFGPLSVKPTLQSASSTSHSALSQVVADASTGNGGVYGYTITSTSLALTNIFTPAISSSNAANCTGLLGTNLPATWRMAAFAEPTTVNGKIYVPVSKAFTSTSSLIPGGGILVYSACQ